MANKQQVTKDAASSIKDEGNTLFEQKQYPQAYEKYTQAIQEDGKSAVLFANRSACLVLMNRVPEALADAKKATEIDSLYPKGWARYAMALEAIGSWPDAFSTWKRAVNTLPIENMTPAELKQRNQYLTKAHNADREARKYRSGNAIVATGKMLPGSVFINEGLELPWMRAKKMIDDKKLTRKSNTSAWRIYDAHEEFSEGVKLMKNLRRSTNSGRIQGELGAIEKITNGILRDERMFHISDRNWMKMCWDQVNFEETTTMAWTDTAPEHVLDEAQERLKSEGWHAVRPALSVTIQTWIARACLPFNMYTGARKDHAASFEWYSNVIDVLERGRRLWKDVSKDERGDVFEEPFITSVRAMRLRSYMDECYVRSPSGVDREFPIEGFIKLADELIEGIKDHEHGGTDEGGYPLSGALGAKANYYRMAANSSNKYEEFIRNNEMAGKLFMDAAQCLPSDEEFRHSALCSAILIALKGSGSPVKILLDMIGQLKIGIEDMYYIWENSALAVADRDKSLSRIWQLGEQLRAKLRKGDLTEDRLIKETWEMDLRPWAEIEDEDK